MKAQYHELQAQIDAAVSEVLVSGRFIGGDAVKRLEERLAAYVGMKHCITCGNGTDALQLALMAWGVGPGDAVFVPDFTFFSSGEVVAVVGATPVFVDVDARSFNIDPAKLEASVKAIEDEGKLTPRAVVAVDLFGLPAEYPTISKICDAHNLLLLEDGAQGFGGMIGERRACSFGNIGTTSFFPAKPLGCYGDGGAVFTDDDEWAKLVRSYAVHGKGSMKYDNVRVGMNSRLDTVQAAILGVKLDAFERSELDAVNRVADLYDDALSDVAVTGPRRYEGVTSSWAQYCVQLPEECDRDALQAELRKRSVPTAVYYPKPMHEQKAFAGRCEVPVSCDETERLCKSVLALPMGPYMTVGDVNAVCSALREALEALS